MLLTGGLEYKWALSLVLNFMFLLFLGVFFSSSMPFLWGVMVLISLEFVRKISSPEVKFKYFFASEVFTLLFFGSLSVNLWLLAPWFMIMKLGIPPFHSWAVELFLEMGANEGVSFLVWVKLLPTLIIQVIGSSDLWALFILAWGFSSIAPLTNLPNLKVVVIFGSYSNYSLFLLASCHNFPSSILFLLSYCFYMVVVWTSWGGKSIYLNKFTIMNIMGLPPFPLFFVKFPLLASVFMGSPLLAIVCLSLSAFLLCSYTYHFSLSKGFTTHQNVGSFYAMFLVVVICFITISL